MAFDVISDLISIQVLFYGQKFHKKQNWLSGDLRRLKTASNYTFNKKSILGLKVSGSISTKKF
jgi:hypothetical protein